MPSQHAIAREAAGLTVTVQGISWCKVNDSSSSLATRPPCVSVGFVGFLVKIKTFFENYEAMVSRLIQSTS
jgi:hypothetical protein